MRQATELLHQNINATEHGGHASVSPNMTISPPPDPNPDDFVTFSLFNDVLQVTGTANAGDGQIFGGFDYNLQNITVDHLNIGFSEYGVTG